MEEKYSKRKRKKPKNHLADAKFYGKKGVFGRGSTIEESQYSYFVNILEASENTFETAEDKAIMASNVFEQTEGHEVHLSSNQVVSRVLENLLGFAGSDVLERFFTVFADEFRPICSHPFASHVLEKLVEVAFLRTIGKFSKLKNDQTEENVVKKIKSEKEVISDENFNVRGDFSQEHRTNCAEFVKRVGKFLLNNLEDYIGDSYANHIMRTCVLLLGGVYVPKIPFDKSKRVVKKTSKYYRVPDDWSEIMLEFPKRLQMWPHFPELAYKDHSSPFLGCICISMKNWDKKQLKHFGSQLLRRSLARSLETDKNEEKTKDDDKSQETLEDTKKLLPEVFQSECSVILLETLISVAGPKLLTQIYAMLFLGRIEALSKDPLANLSVTKLLQHIQEKEDFESIFSELSDELEEILRIGHTRVVEALVQACLRLQSKQSQMIAGLQKALHTTGGGDQKKTMAFFQCLTKLQPYEILIEKNNNFVHMDGSLIIQNILKFSKPIFLVNSILNTSPDILQTIFENQNGSHIVDSFMSSSHIGEKSREKLIRLMEGRYVDLAITKFGSRTVDAFIGGATKQMEKQILKEFSERRNLLNSTFFGRLLSSKYHLGASNKVV